MQFSLNHLSGSQLLVASEVICELNPCLFLQLQVFYNATLEEDEREAITMLLESAKLENIERRKLLIKIANWLEKNIDD